MTCVQCLGFTVKITNLEFFLSKLNSDFIVINFSAVVVILGFCYDIREAPILIRC